MAIDDLAIAIDEHWPDDDDFAHEDAAHRQGYISDDSEQREFDDELNAEDRGPEEVDQTIYADPADYEAELRTVARLKEQ